MKWLSFEERHLVAELAEIVYQDPKSSYPRILDPAQKKDNPIYYFLVPDTVTGHTSRRILGVFDPTGRMVMAIATRSIDYAPVWMISWTLSSLKSAAFIGAWQAAMQHLVKCFEQIGLNEFYVVSPVSKEAIYRRLMAPLRERYWTFVETTIQSNHVAPFGLHWLIMGQHLYSYDLHLRRYILRR